eukprot:11208981-Lingulodinium_polyedra.AAC.1
MAFGPFAIYWWTLSPSTNPGFNAMRNPSAGATPAEDLHTIQTSHANDPGRREYAFARLCPGF